MQIAFYKAGGRLFDRAIRWWTHSAYSHCEFVFSDGMFFSSSPRDGGVRYKVVPKDKSKWDFVDIRMDVFDENTLRRWCDSKVGKRYDWVGIFLSQVLPLAVQDPGRYFCSEILVDALQQVGRLRGIDNPCEVSPQQLYSLLK